MSEAMEVYLRNRGSDIARARTSVKKATTNARGAARFAFAGGMSKSDIARELGITRVTLDHWLVDR